MSTRVTGGTLKGYPIKTVFGYKTRPTTGRVREAIFSILQHEIVGAEVLDVFAGSGSLAIEAMSRGATSAVIIEKNRKAVSAIRENLGKCNLEIRVIAAGYKTGFEILQAEGMKFDLVFADPPYGFILPAKLYELLGNYDLVKTGGFLIMEHSGNLIPTGDKIIKTRRFGGSAITIFNYE